MLEKMPAGIGRVLRAIRPGMQALVSGDEAFAAVPESILVTSGAFTEASQIPARFTDDGERLSPPLQWTGVPAEARGLILLVEDADSPTFRPLVHAILAELSPSDRELAEGALPANGSGQERFGMGRNSYWHTSWLAPDPPRGHGAHHYAFQLFALDEVPSFSCAPGRSALVAVLKDHAIARGTLIGTYARI